MKLRLVKFLLSFYLFFFVLEVLREILLSKATLDKFLNDFTNSLAVALLSSILFLLYALCAYFILFKCYKRFNKVVSALLIIIGMLGVIGTRYLIEEVIIKSITGYGNYFEGTTAFYYILDNLYYAILYTAFGVCWFFIYYSSFKEKQQQELLLVNKKAEVALLKAQLNPHFLFNMLNNIYSLVNMQSTKSLEAIERLSSLLRYSLYESDQMVSISQEFESVQNYIALQKLRHAGNLQIDLKYDPAIGNKKVLPFLLLPLVENSFKHGIIDDPLNPIQISLKAIDDDLSIRVTNMVAIKEKDEVGGIGVENLKKRLQLTYPEAHKFEIKEYDNLFNIEITLAL